MTEGEGTRNRTGSEETAAPAVKKSRRVRTGCLTCRERHLKCDEGLPNCQNCCKSSRICKRGVRLNFIDIQVQAPPIVPKTNEWTVNFIDESRDIASEYKGGLSKYGIPEQDAMTSMETGINFDFGGNASTGNMMEQSQSLPPIQGMLHENAYTEHDYSYEQAREHQSHHQHMHSRSESAYSTATVPQQNTTVSYANAEQQQQQQQQQQQPQRQQQPSPIQEQRGYLTNQEETLFMQVFVEEVGLWMDSMDGQKHVSRYRSAINLRIQSSWEKFSRLLPFHALNEPMLLNAFLACGARHLALINPNYTEDKALHYYDTATRYLLSSLQDPDRDTVICATTAVILNVYEIMCERPLQRMNHIAGARALIKECGWNARSTGVGAACFWLNVGMELLSCLHFNWQVAWDPDEWGVDMDFTRETESGREEVWTYRMVYIVAKICNFRATIPRFQESSSRDEQIRLQNRYNEWRRLKDWCDAWNENIPRTMHPLAYLYPSQTMSQSAFPEIWLIKRTTIVARLFYHTAMVLLAQINPYMPVETEEMRDMQNRHSTQICGIVAHVKDRGVASVALRSLAIAAECLTNRVEQEEVLHIFNKIRQETGWNVGFVNKDLKERWGWALDEPPIIPAGPPSATQQPTTTHHHHSSSIGSQPHTQHQQLSTASYPSTTQPNTSVPLRSYSIPSGILPAGPLPTLQPAATAPPPSVTRQLTPGILNPLLATADFAMPQHPYQNYYVAPNPLAHQSHFGY
jgi:hypothetical protein